MVFIGDFVDRGPDTKAAIQLVLNLMKEHPRTTAVMGNHEFAMCSALDWLPGSETSRWSQRWVDYYDSEATFKSYAARDMDLVNLAEKIPRSHREFLTNLPWCVEHPHFLFVHAGLDPNLSFEDQLKILREKDFTMKRPPWLCDKSFVNADPPPDCPFAVVSGHVKVDRAVIRPRRILVDTTGGESGELSCVLMPERIVLTSSKSAMTAQSRMTETPSSSEVRSSKWWKIWG